MPNLLDESPVFCRYESATLECPLWHLLVGKSNWLLRHMYSLRWHLTRPLQVTVLPCLTANKLPFLRSLSKVTVGHTILTFPLIAMFIVSYEATFVDPAKTSGYMATYAMVATILLANKTNSILSFFFGLSYERLVPMHRLAALLTMLLTCFHARVAYVNNSTVPGAKQAAYSRKNGYYDSPPTREDTKISVWQFLWNGDINITGTLSGVCIALLVGSSFLRVLRHYSFDGWFVAHIVLALFAMVLGIAHKGYGIAPALTWWMLDWVTRKVIMATYGLPRKARVRAIASGTLVELGMSHFHFRAGQFIRIAIPELGYMVFHPFTISSAPSDPEVILHIRPIGDWTRRLLELSRRRDCVDVLVEGPYGGMSMDLDNDHCYPIVLCLAGGIGVTPCRSIARQLLHDEKRGRQLTKIQVVWAVRDLAVVSHLPFLPLGEGKVVQDDTVRTGFSVEEVDGGICVDCFIDDGQGTSIVDDRLQADIFVTAPSTNSGETAVLPERDSNFNMYLGRPDISHILSKVAKLAAQDGVSRVAVICCGPKALVEQARAACRARNPWCFGGGAVVSFDFHEEVFEY